MKRLRVILSRVLEIDEGGVNEDTSPQNVPTWDSFNAMILVSELEEAFHVKFTMDEVTSVKRVKDIVVTLQKHGISLNE